ncbi:uncharacterized protein BO97DRAFT_380290 [Aspergillus homomorphus CBS 101889]|uniref:PhoD-like phosphatase domain-containing protein n=1 Tax=Aspergillus homomorphus (strain CBS 101889) TaxID=1450537 RepID=A0A395IAB3_ASPHC|nr:hypothetical protein BO97DRAFT_380290 [Aspergillus homomorphus CBS 101889]RAL17152.1 hypothetical protein BO97DRAFT_380290 [Aspergillus homomorphus CBS 101889]
MATESTQAIETGDSMSSDQVSTNAPRPVTSHRRQPSQGWSTADYDHDNENYTVDMKNLDTPLVPYNSNPERPHGHRSSRSGSTKSRGRGKNHPEEIMGRTDKLPSLEPSLWSEENEPLQATSARKHGDGGPKASTSNSQNSPLSRSNTRRSTADRGRPLASDRSPLQLLEVSLKEKKRARVLEAEMRLKERMQKEAEGRGAASSQPSNRADPRVAGREDVPRDMSEQTTRHNQPATQGTRRPGHRRLASENRAEYGPLEQNPYEKPRASRTSAPSLPNPLAYSPDEGPYSGVGKSSAAVVSRGTAPRRTVTVSHRTGGPPMGPRAMNTSGHQDSRALEARTFDSAPPKQDRMVPPTRKNVPNQMESGKPGAHAQYDSTTQQGRPLPQAVPDAGPQISKTMLQRDPAKNLGGVAPELSIPLGADLSADLSRETVGTTTSAPSKPKVSFNVPPPTPPPLSEWKTAQVARLGASDFDFQRLDADRSKAWWEGGTSNNRRRSRALPSDFPQGTPTQKSTGSKRFQPPIFLKCGPLLRYGGLKRIRIDGPNGPFNKETWRGSILIVTQDSRSSYEPCPTLRLFSQPMDLLPPPPFQVDGEEARLAPEYVDPTAGLMKLGRDGRALYVKPVDHIKEETDLSLIENDDGLYEMSASMVDYSSEGVKQPVPANRVHSVDGEAAGSYTEVAGARLYADPGRDVTFWRFNIEVELGPTQQRIAYRLNQGPAIGFWVPARGQPMNIMFHTGNGFSPAVDSNKLCGPDPLWRDILNEHQTQPFHVMIGGGDQIFNDKVIAETAHFQEWVKIKSLGEKYDASFTAEFRAELDDFYLGNYSAWFSQGLFSLASSQIPMVNMWNDHEIIEGFGSYPEEFMNSAVISGLGNIAFKYYLLFQHHSVPEETEAEEPSWLLGAQPGPYINQRSRHLFMSLGDGVAFLGLDCRTERMTDEILSEQTCDLIWDRCHREISRGETKHLIVSLSIPIAYPRVAMVKNILNSRKSLGKAGLLGGLVNKTGGKVEIFDDHWTAKHHKSERTYLIEDLQDLAAEKSVRVTILSGDVHLAAVGQFYSNPKLNIPKDKDYRYMPNVISSAIADLPETEMISDMLNKRNRVHHMDTNTDEDMVPIFTHDVNNKPRNNKRLLPRRNWCSIRQYQPGSIPPGTPRPALRPGVEEPRPRKLKRTLSLTRGDKPPSGGLFRRLSGRGPPPTRDFNLGEAPVGRRMSMDGTFPSIETGDGYFQSKEFQPGPLQRRPTNLSQKAGNRGMDTFIDMEEGLAITLNLELNPKDPAGITAPYKLLVPPLRYEGMDFDLPAAPVAKGWKKWLGVRGAKREKLPAEDTEVEDGDGLSDEEEDDEGDDNFENPREMIYGGVVRESNGIGPAGLVGASAEDVEGEEGDKEETTPSKRKKWFGRSK